MKGNFNRDGLFWEAETKGERWEQGQKFEGEVRVTNRTDAPLVVRGGGITLAFADFKKVHAQDAKAFKQQSRAEFPEKELTLAPGAVQALPFSFTLDPNSPVADKKSSHFIVYGDEAGQGHLQAPVTPRPLFLKVVELLSNFHRFKCKEIKTAKQGVEFKFTPPASRDMANVEGLVLMQRMEGEDLTLDFVFNVKKLNLMLPTAPAEKEVKQVVKRLRPTEYLLGRDMPNQDVLLKTMEEVLASIKLKGVF